jgi:hypothetical protein
MFSRSSMERIDRNAARMADLIAGRKLDGLRARRAAAEGRESAGDRKKGCA